MPWSAVPATCSSIPPKTFARTSLLLAREEGEEREKKNERKKVEKKRGEKCWERGEGINGRHVADGGEEENNAEVCVRILN